MDSFAFPAYMLVLVGVALVSYGRRGDPSNGRPRCPKCWYDMRGTLPKLECPECGHDSEQEKNLYRARPWQRLITWGTWIVVFGTLLLLLQVLKVL